VSGFFTAPGAASQPGNPNATLESIGFAANGTPTQLTASATANVKGSYATIGTTTSAWCGFFLHIGVASASTARFLLDIRIGGATVILPDFFVMPGTNIAGRVYVPLQIPASTLVEGRVQCSSTGSQTISFAMTGSVASASLAPGFTQATALNVDTTNSRPSTIDIAETTSLTLPLTQLTASTAATYGAFIAVASASTATPGTAQHVTPVFATGASSSEVEFGRMLVNALNTTAGINHGYQYLSHSVASGTRLSAGALAAATGDNIRVGLYGFA